MQTEVFALWTHFWVHFIIFDKLSKKQIVRKVHENAKKDPKTDVFESYFMVREAGLEPARPE